MQLEFYELHKRLIFYRAIIIYQNYLYQQIMNCYI